MNMYVNKEHVCTQICKLKGTRVRTHRLSEVPPLSSPGTVGWGPSPPPRLEGGGELGCAQTFTAFSSPWARLWRPPRAARRGGGTAIGPATAERLRARTRQVRPRARPGTAADEDARSELRIVAALLRGSGENVKPTQGQLGHA